MRKPVSTQLKRLGGLIVLVIIVILIGGSCVLDNHSPDQLPVINSLTTDCPRVRPGHTATITCDASDPEGDELSYIWLVNAGDLTGEGDTVTWVAPSDYGTYTITVTVTNDRGGQASQSIDIIVCSCGSAC